MDWCGEPVRVTSWVPETGKNSAYYRTTVTAGDRKGKRLHLYARDLEALNPDAPRVPITTEGDRDEEQRR